MHANKYLFMSILYICVHIQTHTFMLIVYKVELRQMLEIKHSSKFEEFKLSLLDITTMWNIGMIDKWHARTAKYSPGTKSYIHTCLLPKADIFCQWWDSFWPLSQKKSIFWFFFFFQMTFAPVKKTDTVREGKTNQTVSSILFPPIYKICMCRYVIWSYAAMCLS